VNTLVLFVLHTQLEGGIEHVYTVHTTHTYNVYVCMCVHIEHRVLRKEMTGVVQGQWGGGGGVVNKGGP
jgi:hypothetical protein